jgi:phage shock protein A
MEPHREAKAMTITLPDEAVEAGAKAAAEHAGFAWEACAQSQWMGDARAAIGDNSKGAAFDRMKNKVAHNEAVTLAKSELGTEDVEDRLNAIEKDDRIEQLLAEMKAKRA